MQLRIEKLNLQRSLSNYQATCNNIKMKIIAAYLEVANSKELIEESKVDISNIEIQLKSMVNGLFVYKAVNSYLSK